VVRGGRSNQIGIEQFYWKTQVGNTFRLIEPDDIDFVLDEDEVAWTLEYPHLTISPRSEGQWVTTVQPYKWNIPFNVGLDGLHEVYNVIFKQLDTYLRSRNITNLAICPDGALALFPFAAMIDDEGKFLVDKYSVSYTPNLSTLLWCLSNSSRMVRRAALIKDGTGTLPLAGDEVTIATKYLASAEPLLISEWVNEDTAINQLSERDLLHLACHARFDIDRPERSGIELDAFTFIRRIMFPPVFE
jgi:hypothetical protein